MWYLIINPISLGSENVVERLMHFCLQNFNVMLNEQLGAVGFGIVGIARGLWVEIPYKTY